MVAEFEADFFGTVEEPPRFASIALGVGLLDDAALLGATRGLRAYDAVQLVSSRRGSPPPPTRPAGRSRRSTESSVPPRPQRGLS